jgi:mannose-6-phosphate isomerase-like protein (cupin superfamily)
MNAALLLHRADGGQLSCVYQRAAFGAGDPWGAAREIAWQGPGAMGVGRITMSGEIDVASHPHTEIWVVVEGEVSLRAPGSPARVLSRGEGAVIARGTALQVQVRGGAVVAFCAFSAFEAEARRLGRFFRTGHTPGKMQVPKDERNPNFPFTLDLRRATSAF